MHWKNKLKEIPLIYEMNARVKSVQLKRDLAAIARRYERKIRSTGASYDEQRAIATFQERRHRLNPGFRGEKPPGALNIFWVGASQAQDESGFLQALQQLGSVYIFRNSAGGYGLLAGYNGAHCTQIRRDNNVELIRQVTGAHMQGGIDVLIGQMWAQLCSGETLSKVRALGIPVVNIAMDDRLPIHWSTQEGIRMGSVGLGAGVDITLTTCAETCAWYAAEDMPAIFWPLASDASLFAAPSDAIRDIDLLFIGNCYGIRKKIVDDLAGRGIEVTCYGGGWPNGYVNAEQNIALSKRAKIILGVGTVGHCSDVYTLKLRDFDALMTGALYITHRNPDLLRMFKEGQHLECYVNSEELFEKLSFYLQHPAESTRIGREGQSLAIAEHTWDHRFSETFQRLGLLA